MGNIVVDVDVNVELPLAVLLPDCDELLLPEAVAEADGAGVTVKTIGTEVVTCCLFVPEILDLNIQ